MIGVEGFAGAEDAEDQMEELGHDGADDDDGLFAFGIEPFGEGFAQRIEAHGAHGRKEEGFAKSRRAGFAHRRVVGTAGAALVMARGDARVGGELPGVIEIREIGDLSEDDGGGKFADAFDPAKKVVMVDKFGVVVNGGQKFGFHGFDMLFEECDGCFEVFFDEGFACESQSKR